MELLGFFTIGLALLVYTAKGERRCVCNEPSCVSTGYMCKSSLDGCFAQLTYDAGPKMSKNVRQGCVESLSEEDRNICDLQGTFVQSSNENWPILMCCNSDMCNYLDLTQITVENPKRSTPKTSNGSSKGPEADYPRPGPQGPVRPPEYNPLEEKDLWFKAAVIAVPIAGGFILILLVLLAIRMLRNDSRRHRQLMQVRHRSLAKAQLYVTDHFCKRDPEKCPRLMTGHANPYSDVNIKIDHNSQGYEKIRPASDSSVHEGSVNSVITWGGRPERATNV